MTEQPPQPDPHEPEPEQAESKQPDAEQTVTPSRRDRLRPAEFIGFAVVLGLFTGAIVYFTTRELSLAGIFAGAAVVAVLVTVALIGLGGAPSKEDLEARKDLQTPDEGNRWH